MTRSTELINWRRAWQGTWKSRLEKYLDEHVEEDKTNLHKSQSLNFSATFPGSLTFSLLQEAEPYLVLFKMSVQVHKAVCMQILGWGRFKGLIMFQDLSFWCPKGDWEVLRHSWVKMSLTFELHTVCLAFVSTWILLVPLTPKLLFGGASLLRAHRRLS